MADIVISSEMRFHIKTVETPVLFNFDEYIAELHRQIIEELERRGVANFQKESKTNH
jgi:hypothetical protein